MQKGFGFLGILLVVAIVAGIGAFTFDSLFPDKSPFAPSKEEKNAIDMAEQMKDVLEQKNADTQQDETVDWKTYRNEEYGFEFQYPKELTIDERIQPNNSQLLYVWLPFEKEVPVDYGFELDIRALEPNDNADDNKPNTSIDGIPAFQSSELGWNDSEIVSTIFVYRGSRYYFSVTGKEQELLDDRAKQIYTKIFSTFKFIK